MIGTPESRPSAVGAEKRTGKGRPKAVRLVQFKLRLYIVILTEFVLVVGSLMRLLKLVGWSCAGAAVVSILQAYNLRGDPHFTTELYGLGFALSLPAMLIASMISAASSQRVPAWAAILLGCVAAPLAFIAYMSILLPGYEIYYPVTIPSALIAIFGLTLSSQPMQTNGSFSIAD